MDRGILYIIADRKLGDEKILEVLEAGVDLIQLREKDISSAKYLEDALWLRKQTERTGTVMIVNDRLDIALASGADGVHLGSEDIPVAEAKRIAGMCGLENFLVGATAKTREQAVWAMEQGADYIGSGAWFSTSTKPDAVPISDETFREIRQLVNIPIVAIGGLTAENCKRPLDLGADGVAVAGGVFGADSVTDAVRAFRGQMKLWCGRKAGWAGPEL